MDKIKVHLKLIQGVLFCGTAGILGTTLGFIAHRLWGWTPFVILGLWAGIGAGCFCGFHYRSPFKTVMYGLVGGVIGLISGFYAGLYAVLFYQMFSWGIIGLAMGIAYGFAQRSNLSVIISSSAGISCGIIVGTVSKLNPLNSLLNCSLIIIAILFFEVVLRQAWLVVLKGRNEGLEYNINKTLTIIGRKYTNDISLEDDEDVANHHATIINKSGSYILFNENKRYPLLVNHQHIGEKLLVDGDYVRVGNTLFVFRERLKKTKIEELELIESKDSNVEAVQLSWNKLGKN